MTAVPHHHPPDPWAITWLDGQQMTQPEAWLRVGDSHRALGVLRAYRLPVSIQANPAAFHQHWFEGMGGSLDTGPHSLEILKILVAQDAAPSLGTLTARLALATQDYDGCLNRANGHGHKTMPVGHLAYVVGLIESHARLLPNAPVFPEDLPPLLEHPGLLGLHAQLTQHMLEQRLGREADARIPSRL